MHCNPGRSDARELLRISHTEIKGLGRVLIEYNVNKYDRLLELGVNGPPMVGIT